MIKNTFIKFLLVGVMNTIIGLSIMYICLNVFRLHYWPSTFIGNSVGAVVSYLLNRAFTFQSTVSHKRGMVRFVVVITVCYFFSYQLAYSLTEWFLSTTNWLNDEYVADIAILIGSGVYTISNYFGQKLLVFNKKN